MFENTEINEKEAGVVQFKKILIGEDVFVVSTVSASAQVLKSKGPFLLLIFFY